MQTTVSLIWMEENLGRLSFGWTDADIGDEIYMIRELSSAKYLTFISPRMKVRRYV